MKGVVINDKGQVIYVYGDGKAYKVKDPNNFRVEWTEEDGVYTGSIPMELLEEVDKIPEPEQLIREQNGNN
jgi:hypothetical protein